MISNIDCPTRDQVKMIEKRLELCRNQLNNPDSNEFKRSLQDSKNDENGSVRKYAKLSEKQRLRDDNYIEATSSQ